MGNVGLAVTLACVPEVSNAKPFGVKIGRNCSSPGEQFTENVTKANTKEGHRHIAKSQTGHLEANTIKTAQAVEPDRLPHKLFTLSEHLWASFESTNAICSQITS